jgi:hypothetical protein
VTLVRRRYSVWILRSALGALLTYAGCAKLAAPRAFAVSIIQLQLFPFTWTDLIVATLPIAELLTGAWLICGWRPRASLLAAMILTAGFIFAAVQASVRGLSFNCHCFGLALESPSPGWVAMRAALLFAFAATLRAINSAPLIRRQPKGQAA